MKGLELKNGLSGKEIQNILSNRNVASRKVEHNMQYKHGPYFIDTALTTSRKLGYIEKVLEISPHIRSPSSASLTYYAWHLPTKEFTFDQLKDGIITIENRMLVERTRIYGCKK